ncbi:hypothetical protein [Pseudaminobacter soli (ex Li et al. 2025)]|uniref:DUF551 domain-containing protein n=1 Tax=Pseudaminobacter soli (ex Li et al. 2025) TaxID=1295366 RepID=A0A2P7SE62_9HYPH|nr:hypothetical protein [Mesorhizobium soli]PSJ60804.1 hypothetical protein C7I85_12240 [Mesorhizobium soli]
MSARDTIARAVIADGVGLPSEYELVDAILEALAAAGYTIVPTGGVEKAVDGLEEAMRLAEVGEYLYNECAYSYGDGYTEPREYGIEWQWQQSKPDEFGQGHLLAAATKWHGEQLEGGAETEATKLRAAISSLHMPVQAGWQPIETAPKDKTSVIIAVPTKDMDDYIIGEAYFDPENYAGGDWWWAGTSHGDYHTDPVREANYHLPSFWQSLPAAPLSSRPKGGA